MDSSDIIQGACNCGRITVLLPRSSLPKASSLCHCLNCRASSGSLSVSLNLKCSEPCWKPCSFAVNLPTPTKDITVEGTPKIHSDIAASGNTSDRLFCGDCGRGVFEIKLYVRKLMLCSAIMTVVKQRPEIAFLKGGLFAKFGVDLPAPGREQFWRRAEKWEKPHEGVTTLIE